LYRVQVAPDHDIFNAKSVKTAKKSEKPPNFIFAAFVDFSIFTLKSGGLADQPGPV